MSARNVSVNPRASKFRVHPWCYINQIGKTSQNPHTTGVSDYRTTNRHKFRVGVDRRVRLERFDDHMHITKFVYACGVASNKMATRHINRIQPAFRITEPQFATTSA